MANKRPITAEELGKFSIDESNKLYWDGNPIKSESVVLSLWQKIFAFVLGLSAILASLTAVNQEFCIVPIGSKCTKNTEQTEKCTEDTNLKINLSDIKICKEK